MKALTIWQPWATLIMVGAKPFEFRKWAAPRSLVGQRIVIHAGSRKVVRDELRELLMRLTLEKGFGTGLHADKAVPLLERALTSPGILPLASALGTACLGEPRKASALFKGDTNDSDRIDHAIWAWPMQDVQPFEPFVPIRGAQGFWNYPEHAA